MVTFIGVRNPNGSIVPLIGDPVIHKFDFTHATPGLAAGVNIYSPTIGDILLDAWIEIDTAFDGTTPLADISQFVNGTNGWFRDGCTHPVDLTGVDGFEIDSGGLLSASGDFIFSATTSPPAAAPGALSLSQVANTFTTTSGTAFSGIGLTRAVPAKFAAALPVQLVVSQDGTKGGTPTAATVGAGTVYLLVGTPA